MTPDFSGYATKYGVRCTDGRTIRDGAFNHMHGRKVPLLWQHGHRDVDNIVGHALLEARGKGLYAQAFLNDTDRGQHAKKSVAHGDITSFSIYANRVQQEGSDVIHGEIVEVSLVLAPANPEATIDPVTIRHYDGELEDTDDEFIIKFGENIEHEDKTDSKPEKKSDDKTVADIYDSMSQEQKDILHYMLATVMDNDNGDKTAEKEKEMAHSNIFEPVVTGDVVHTEGGKSFTAADMIDLVDKSVAHAMDTGGKFQDSFAHTAKEYGISNPEMLFPNAKMVGEISWQTPEDSWVSPILDHVSHSPFARIKSMSINLNEDKLRAKGYITGEQKKEGVFGALSRETTPKTVYVKSKLDRDDVLDTAGHDIVGYMNKALNIMMRLELGRAILIGDGRQDSDHEKIDETKIRPIATDDPLYTTPVNLPKTLDAHDTIDAIIVAKKHYKGSGKPVLFMSYEEHVKLLLVKDANKRRIYNTDAELCSTLGVSEIVDFDEIASRKTKRNDAVEANKPIRMLMVNPKDYVIGNDPGGQLTSFTDFDIDFNQMKYLLETRLSGALREPKTAVVFYAGAAAASGTRGDA